MNKIIKLLGVAALGLTIVACSDDDEDAVVTPPGVGVCSISDEDGVYVCSGPANQADCEAEELEEGEKATWSASCPANPGLKCHMPDVDATLYAYGWMAEFYGGNCPAGWTKQD